MTPAELKTEITTGPLAAELATPYAARDVVEVHRLLHLPRASMQVNRGAIPMDDFLSDFAGPIKAAITNANLTLQAKWKDYLTYLLRGKVTVNVSGARFAPFLAEAVTDGLMTQAAADAIKTRNGSRMEQLGWNPSVDDVLRAY